MQGVCNIDTSEIDSVESGLDHPISHAAMNPEGSVQETLKH
jgi:hypothetical protein